MQMLAGISSLRIYLDFRSIYILADDLSLLNILACDKSVPSGGEHEFDEFINLTHTGGIVSTGAVNISLVVYTPPFWWLTLFSMYMNVAQNTQLVVFVKNTHCSLLFIADGAYISARLLHKKDLKVLIC